MVENYVEEDNPLDPPDATSIINELSTMLSSLQ